MFALGEGGSPDLREAVRRCQPAAASGHADAQMILGRWYLFGSGAPKDPVKGTSLVTCAAEQGNMAASNLICMALAVGVNVPKDLRRAAPWCVRGSGCGYVASSAISGVVYAHGSDVPMD